MVVCLHRSDALGLCGLGSVVRGVLALDLVSAGLCGFRLHLGNLRCIFQLGPSISAVIAIGIRSAEGSSDDQSNYSPCRQLTTAKQFCKDGYHG